MELYRKRIIIAFAIIAIGSIVADFAFKAEGSILIVMGFLVMPLIVFVLNKLRSKQE